MRFVTKLSIFLISMVIALKLAEAALQLYVTKIVGRGKLFSADPGTGWRPLPMLQLTRLNAGGEKWRIETDRTGQRVLDVPANPKRTILILGDSYAFGEGVNIEDRFDQKIREAFPDGRIINTGVMGFGTDQQYVAAKPYFPDLTDNDIVLVLFGRNVSSTSSDAGSSYARNRTSRRWRLAINCARPAFLCSTSLATGHICLRCSAGTLNRSKANTGIIARQLRSSDRF
jgi:hypothetical protein